VTVIRVVSPWVYGVTGVVGEPLETLVCFRFVGWADSKNWESGWRCSWRCMSLSAAHGGCRTVRTVTMTTTAGSGQVSSAANRSDLSMYILFAAFCFV
jgi:hypothetical protein